MLSLLALLFCANTGLASPIAEIGPSSHRSSSLDATIAKVESMVWDSTVNQMVRDAGLNVVNVTWEDTGRSKGSVWGPNISDMTIGVRDSRGQLHPMPVMRFDNFNDKTADLRSDRFSLLVGNEDGRRLEPVTLERILRDTRSFLHNPNSWGGSARSLWSSRDEHVLVSAQAAFLPVPKRGAATFTPVIYNYQSRPGAPAVLTLVATREGTSIQVVENDSGYMSDVLFFNEDGKRAPLTATRLSDFNAQARQEGKRQATAEDGLDMVLVVQVPLKIPRQQRSWSLFSGGIAEDAEMSASAGVSKRSSDVEAAVIGHGPTEGPYKELAGLSIERDHNFPVRVTVQFYKATSNGIVTKADVQAVRAQIDRVYADGDYVGSLVTNGYTGRPTEWTQADAGRDIWAKRGWGWLKAW
jgi:hypothetical protein